MRKSVCKGLHLVYVHKSLHANNLACFCLFTYFVPNYRCSYTVFKNTSMSVYPEKLYIIVLTVCIRYNRNITVCRKLGHKVHLCISMQ